MKDAIQEQLIAARRNQILDSAAKVFAEKGFHPTTIKDIAREAGIADGTIYNYFENKTALLLGIFDQMREAIQPDEEFLRLDVADFRRYLAAYFRYPLMAFQNEKAALFRVIVSEMMVNKELRDLYYQRILEPTLAMGEQLLQQWATKQLIKPVNVSLTIRAMAAVILGVMVEQQMGDAMLNTEVEALPEFLATLFVDGIGNIQS